MEFHALTHSWFKNRTANKNRTTNAPSDLDLDDAPYLVLRNRIKLVSNKHVLINCL